MTAVFRIAQESLANIARHARAAHIHVEVGLNDESNWFVLNIRDDGQGFDTQSPASGLGLNSMRARAEEIGAHLEIRSNIGERSEVLLYLPASDPHVESYSRHLRRFVTTVSLLVPVALVTWLDIPWRSHLIPLLLFGAGIAVFHGVEFARLKWLHTRS
jgi:glucose-6-phosphate-specific signal transduction histidine kinase